MITLIQVQLILRKMAYIVNLTMDKLVLKIMDHNAIKQTDIYVQRVIK